MLGWVDNPKKQLTVIAIPMVRRTKQREQQTPTAICVFSDSS